MEEINKVVAQANKLYALQSYTEAADLYAYASEDLANLIGEGNAENADILFLYGRTLLKLALQRSEVLGSGMNNNEVEAQNQNTATANRSHLADSHFSFQGDEENDVSEDEKKSTPPDEIGLDGAAESEDVFQSAWEVLDMARIAFHKQLESPDKFEDKIKVKKSMADTYDALGEIALENENFNQAVADLKVALELKLEMYEESSSQCTGAHYMLALALEYCTSPSSREAAANEIKASIRGFELRLEALDQASKEARDQREMLEELKIKLAELQAPTEINMKDAIVDMFGNGKTVLKESIVQAMQNSTDISSLVRKKEKKRVFDNEKIDTSIEVDAESSTMKKPKVAGDTNFQISS